MSFPSGLDISRGIAGGLRPVRQFGRNANVGGSYVPVSRAGSYMTPQVATELRVAAGGNAADSATGIGARSIMLTGIGANGEAITEIIPTNGVDAGAYSTAHFLRLTAAYVYQSGTYATQTAQSHVGEITIADSAGNVWAVIADTDIPRGSAEIGAYTVPKTRSLFIESVRIQCSTGNKTNVVMYRRPNILQVTPPYSAMTLIGEFPDFTGVTQFQFNPPIMVSELTDVGFLARSSSGTIDVCASFNAVEIAP